ncbi:hypothetical protein ACU8KH_00009 [Lachancea thermotolerans]
MVKSFEELSTHLKIEGAFSYFGKTMFHALKGLTTERRGNEFGKLSANDPDLPQ